MTREYNRIAFEKVEQLFNENGLKLPFNDYKNNQTRLSCYDDEGYILMIAYGKLQSGRKPSRFGKGNPFTIRNIKNYLKINDIPYILLSDQFINANSHKLKWECDKGHPFEMPWNNFYSQGYRCMYCSGNAKKTTEIFKREIFNLVKNEYSLLSKYVNDSTHVFMKHNICNYIYPVTPTHFLKDRRCPKCRYKTGPDHHSYNPEITDEEREKKRHLNIRELKKWRKEVFSRDDFTCQLCNEKGGHLNAHHLDGYHWSKHNRFDINNGITLCIKCHRKFHSEYGIKNNTKQQFENFKKNILKHVYV